jgi:hypothetical protein
MRTLVKCGMSFIIAGILALQAGIASGQDRISLTGQVMAYVVSNLSVHPHGYLPARDELIVKVKKSKENKLGYVRLINEYFSDTTNLPAILFREGGKWKFDVIRRFDCDGPLSTTRASQSIVVNGESFSSESPTHIEYIKPVETVPLASEQSILCYSIRTLVRQ